MAAPHRLQQRSNVLQTITAGGVENPVLGQVEVLPGSILQAQIQNALRSRSYCLSSLPPVLASYLRT